MRKSDTRILSMTDIPVALVLLTRLPMPTLTQAAFDRQANSVWAFPLVGLVVGLLSALVGLGALWIGMAPVIAAGLLVMTQVVLTGAMHEDGLADCADGFWGGFDPNRRLDIMKDSQIGTYGVLALVGSVGLRWMAISVLLANDSLSGVIGAAIISRTPMAVLMSTLPHAREAGLARSVGTPPETGTLIAVGIAGALAMLLVGVLNAIVLISLIAGVALACAKLARSKIGGQTGDVLGATQQCCEIAGLCVLSVLLAA